MPRKLIFPFILMLIQATIFGATFSVNKLAATAGIPPFAYSFWQSLGAAILLLIFVYARGDRVGFTRAHLISYLVVGGIGVGIPTALLTIVAPRLPAGALTLGLALVPSFTYAMSLLIGLERFRALGLVGLLLGFAGVAVVVGPGDVLGGSGSWAWYLLGLVGPLMFAICNVAGAALSPPVSSPTSMACGMQLGSAIASLPIMLASGQAWVPIGISSDAAWPMLVATLISTYIYILFFIIVRRTGPTFFSQLNYFAVVSGVVWGIAIWHEHPSVELFVAMLLMFSGAFVSGYRHKSKAEMDAVGSGAASD